MIWFFNNLQIFVWVNIMKIIKELKKMIHSVNNLQSEINLDLSLEMRSNLELSNHFNLLSCVKIIVSVIYFFNYFFGKISECQT